MVVCENNHNWGGIFSDSESVGSVSSFQLLNSTPYEEPDSNVASACAKMLAEIE